MKDHPEPDLEAVVHQELQKLPDLAAPPSLIPRVRNALEKRAFAPWWHRAWWDWPQTARWSAAVLALAVLVICCGWPIWIGAWTAPLAGEAGALLQPGRDAWNEVAPVGRAVFVLGRSLGSTPWLALAAFVSVALYMVCVGVGSVFVRFFWQPARLDMPYEK